MQGSLRNGYVTEQEFTVEAMRRGLTVSRPIANIEPYDFIVEHEHRMIRVQVKKCYQNSRGHNVADLRNNSMRSSGTKRTCITTSDRIDFVALYCESEGLWYVIPLEVIQHLKSNVIVSIRGKYSSYIDNWEFKY